MTQTKPCVQFQEVTMEVEKPEAGTKFHKVEPMEIKLKSTKGLHVSDR